MLKQDTLGRVRTPKEKREAILAEYDLVWDERAGVCAVCGGEIPDVGDVVAKAGSELVARVLLNLIGRLRF